MPGSDPGIGSTTLAGEVSHDWNNTVRRLGSRDLNIRARRCQGRPHPGRCGLYDRSLSNRGTDTFRDRSRRCRDRAEARDERRDSSSGGDETAQHVRVGLDLRLDIGHVILKRS